MCAPYDPVNSLFRTMCDVAALNPDPRGEEGALPFPRPSAALRSCLLFALRGALTDPFPADELDGDMYFNEDEAEAAVAEERMHTALERLDARLVVDTSRFDDDEEGGEEEEEEGHMDA